MRLVEENRRRGLDAPEFELMDAGVFDEGRYFDVVAEYAKRSPNDLVIFIIRGESKAVNAKGWGTKAAPHYRLHLAPGESQTIRLRLYSEAEAPSGTTASECDEVFAVASGRPTSSMPRRRRANSPPPNVTLSGKATPA